MKDVVPDAEVGGSPAASRNETPNRAAAQDHRCEQAKRGHQVCRQRGNDGSQWYQQLADANPTNVVVGREDFQAGGAAPGSKRPYVHALGLHPKLDIIELGRFQQPAGLLTAPMVAGLADISVLGRGERGRNISLRVSRLDLRPFEAALGERPNRSGVTWRMHTSRIRKRLAGKGDIRRDRHVRMRNGPPRPTVATRPWNSRRSIRSGGARARVVQHHGPALRPRRGHRGRAAKPCFRKVHGGSRATQLAIASGLST